MAPHIQPPSLRRLALVRTAVALDRACAKIRLEHGQYGSEECATKVCQLQVS